VRGAHSRPIGAFGIITLLIGIAALVWPGRTLVVVAVLLGIWLIVFGAMQIAAAFRIRSLIAHA
jgi:uncharacterized membrane protein HdeD (DUF308 family)